MGHQEQVNALVALMGPHKDAPKILRGAAKKIETENKARLEKARNQVKELLSPRKGDSWTHFANGEYKRRIIVKVTKKHGVEWCHAPLKAGGRTYKVKDWWAWVGSIVGELAGARIEFDDGNVTHLSVDGGILTISRPRKDS